MEHNRTVAPDFDAAIVADSGHYPMLERPAEFNRRLVDFVRGFEGPLRGR